MRATSMPLLSVLFAVPACGDIEVQSVRTQLAIPLGMQGEWAGSWSSARAMGTGTMGMRLQSFAGEAIVSIAIDNPCVVPRSYQIFVTGKTIELRADGEVVLAAVLGDDRTMTGTYQCDADTGMWHVAWQHDLSPIVDLGGRWEGTVSSAASGEVPMILILDQSVRSGAVVVDGSLVLPGLLPTPLGVTGSLHFREGSFDFLLSTTSGVFPAMQLAGIGSPVTLAIRDGLLLAAPSPLLPFQNAVWQMTWQNH